MATLTTQVVNRGGTIPTYYAVVAGGDAMQCGSGMFLHIKSANGTPQTVTLVVPAARTYEPNVSISNVVVGVANASEKMIGPVDAQTFADPTTGLCSITYSTATSITATAVQLSQP